MPINVTGVTDSSGAISVLPGASKVVCVVGRKGTGVGTQAAGSIFPVVSTSDAATKWGAGAKAIQVVSALIRTGVSQIVGIMVPETDATLNTVAMTYDSALDKLLPIDCKIIVLDTVDSTVIPMLRNHLDVAEAEDKFRYGVTSGSGDNSALTTLATGINSKRMFVVGPVNTDAKTGLVNDPIVTAAEVAGLIATETSDPALPMNGVEVPGSGAVSRVLLKAEREALVNGGVTPLITTPGGLTAVYRLVTTYTKDTQGANDPTWQEGTTVFIADDVLETNQARIRTNYKRTKNVGRILKSMRTDIIDVLAIKEKLEIIENVNPDTVSVVKDPEDSYGALIDYEFDVVTPLYNVTIRQHMKL